MAKGYEGVNPDSGAGPVLTKGYEGTSIRKLSASLGLVKSGIYRHFESQEAIWITFCPQRGKAKSAMSNSA